MVTRLSYFNQMKVTSFLPWLTAVVLCVATFLSCSDDWEEPYLHIADDELTTNSAGGTLAIPVECNTHWQVLSCPTWVTVDSPEGNGTSELLLNVAANNSFARSGNVVIAANAVVQTVALTQQASTSGRLSVVTGSYTVSGFLSNYTLTFDFTISNPHLASSAGIIYGGQKIPCSQLGSYNYVEISLKTFNPYGGTYQAYAVNASTGNIIYGSIKTVSKQ